MDQGNLTQQRMNIRSMIKLPLKNKSPENWEYHQIETQCHFLADHSNSLIRLWILCCSDLENGGKESGNVAPVGIKKEHMCNILVEEESDDKISTHEY